MRKYTLLVAAAALTGALSVGVGTATAAKGGNSANAKLCQKGGWMNLQGSDGTQFKNQGKCVSFGAHGGTIVPIPSSLSISYTPTGDPNFCNVTVHLSHFTPNTQYTVDMYSFGLANPMEFDGSFPVTTDGSGAGSITPFSFLQNGVNKMEAFVGTVSSGFQLVTC
jgi:hypothetical protein